MQEPTPRDHLEGGWELTPGQDAPALPSSMAPASSQGRFRNRQFFNNLFINTKSKLYNLYRPMCKTLPNFSGSPIYMLGVCYRQKPSPKAQQQQRTRATSSPKTEQTGGSTNNNGTNSGQASGTYSPYSFFYMYSSSVARLGTSAPVERQSNNSSGNGQMVEVDVNPNNNNNAAAMEKSNEEAEEGDEKQREGSSTRQKSYDDDDELVPYESQGWEGLPPNVKEFLRDFQSRPWFTYRNQFPLIGTTTYTTDMGWGCMLRTGQMMLAQCLMCHLFGRDWRMHPFSPRDVHNFRALIRLFADEPLVKSPYSIHNIAQVAAERFNKKVGEWFEPTVLAHTIRVLVEKHRTIGLKVYVPRDPIIYRLDVENLCRTFRSSTGETTPRKRSSNASRSSSTSGSSSSSGTTSTSASAHENSMPTSTAPSEPQIPTSPVTSMLTPVTASPLDSSTDSPGSSGKSPTLSSSSGTSSSNPAHGPSLQDSGEGWIPLLIIIPVRLGIQELNRIYIPALKRFMALRQSVGIVGGKPHSSYYFVGFQDDNALYLDPHVVNAAVKMEDNFSIDTYHTDIPQAMYMGELDPSLALGFYCASRADFDDLCKNIVQIGEEVACVISIGEKDPERPEVVDVSKSCPAVLHGYGDGDDDDEEDNAREELDPEDEEDMVFI